MRYAPFSVLRCFSISSVCLKGAYHSAGGLFPARDFLRLRLLIRLKPADPAGSNDEGLGILPEPLLHRHFIDGPEDIPVPEIPDMAAGLLKEFDVRGVL